MTIIANFEPLNLGTDNYIGDLSVGIEDFEESPQSIKVHNYRRCFQDDFLRLFENFYRVIQSEERHFEEAIASFDYAKFKWTPDLENAVDSDEQTADGLVDFNITGQVLKISSREAEVDCFGGDTIFMLRARTRGDWNMLKVGTWFKGTAWISESGEVYRATIDEEIPPLDSIHDGELDDFYNRIMRGEFTSKK